MSEPFQRPVVSKTNPVISMCKAGLGLAAQLRGKDFGDSAEIENVLPTIEILPAPQLDPLLAREGTPDGVTAHVLTPDFAVLPVSESRARHRHGTH